MSKREISYVLNLSANIGDLQNQLNQAKTAISSLTKDGKNPGLSRLFEGIEKSIDNIVKKTSTPITSGAMFGSIQKDVQSINLGFSKLNEAIQDIVDSSDGEILDLLPPDFVKKINDAIAATSKYEKALQDCQKESKELTLAKKEEAKAEKDLLEAQSKRTNAENNLNTAKGRLDNINKEITASQKLIEQRKKEAKEADDFLKKVEAAYDTPDENGKKPAKNKKIVVDGQETSLKAAKNKKAKADQSLDLENQHLEGLNAEAEGASSLVSGFEKELNKADQAVSRFQINADTCKEKVANLQKEFESNSADQAKKAFQDLRQTAESLGISLDGISPEGTAEDVAKLTAAFEDFAEDGLIKANLAAQDFQKQVGGMQDTTKMMGQQVGDAAQSWDALNEAQQKANSMEQRIKQFIGMAGAAKVLKEALKDAFNTVKELDAVMTEMAVVTDLDVGDYWDQMPEYSKRAQELGVSIKGTYEAATLYYQQGLKTNEVMALSNETLKMAKIAGLEASDATDRMTAALRGFNMEMNEASAQKVADVYSQLAAITASDVDEISTAMTKTASIASNAGMEFETTAAFLSQIIETTRESAETAGTAMKTVIARFQELKKDPSQIGEIDGEIVDANKIETALRSVGVSLRDSQGQFRDLDDVFMELSSKWDTLDTNTQRYIATIAAGSRQQSRFIAMMSNYGRTQELVGEAQNSAGASNKQYEKTLDSLDSKLAQLKNAWDQFTTGIMNSDLVKFFVDLLTKILTTINRVTEGFNGFTQSISKVGTILAIFNLAKAAFQRFGKDIKAIFVSLGESFSSSMISANEKAINQMKQDLQEFKKDASQPAPVSTPSSSTPVSGQGTPQESQAKPWQFKKNFKQGVTGMAQANMGTANQQQLNKDFNESVKQTKKINQESDKEIAAADVEIQAAEEEAKVIEKEEAPLIQTQKFDQTIQNADGRKGLANALQSVEGGDQLMATDLPFDDLEAQFKTTVQNFGMEADVAEERWKALMESFKAEGTTALDAINQIDAEMDAQYEENKAKMEAEGKSVPMAKKKLQTGDVKKKAKERDEKRAEVKDKKDKNKDKLDKANAKKDKAQEKKNDAQKKLQEQEEAYQQKTMENTQMIKEGYNKLTSSITNAGTALSTAGMAVGALGGALESLGMDGAAEAFNKFGNVLSTVGGIVSVFGTLMGALKPVIDMVSRSQSKQAASSLASAAASGTDTAAKGAQTGAMYGLATGEVVATACAGPFGAIMLVILLVVLLLIVAIIALVAAFMAFKKASPEGQLKAAEEAADEAAAAADRAAESYKNLKDALDGLKNKYKNLEDLTKGTQEWNDAVTDINQSVMDLIDQYPELAQFVKSEGGVLTLDTESQEVQNVLNAKQQAAVQTKNMEYAAKINVIEKQNAVKYDNLSNKAIIGNAEALDAAKAGSVYGMAVGTSLMASFEPISFMIGAAITTASAGAMTAIKAQEAENKKNTDAMAQALAKGAVTKDGNGGLKVQDSAELARLGLNPDDMEAFGKELGDSVDELKKYGQELEAASAQVKAFYQSMATSALTSVLTSGEFTEDQQAQMSTVASDTWAQAFAENAQNEYNNMSKDQKKQAKLQVAQAKYGDTAKVKGNKIIYTDEEGKEQKVKMTEEGFAQAYGAQEATKGMQDALKELPGAINEVSKMAEWGSKNKGSGSGGGAKAMQNLFSAKEGANLTEKDLKSLSFMTDRDLRGMYAELSEDQKKAFGSEENFIKTVTDSIAISQATYDDARNKLTKAAGEAAGEFQFDKNIGSEQFKGLTDHLVSIATYSGETGVKEMQESINNAMKGLDDESANQFVSLLNGVDWTSKESIGALPELLKDANIAISDQELEALIADFEEFSGAVDKVDLSKLTEQLQNAAAIVDKISTGEQSRSFSSADYEKLIEIDPSLADDFQMDRSGNYIYLGNTMEDLIAKIEENTSAVNDSTMSTLQSQVDAATVYEDLYSDVDTEALKDKNDEYKQDFLEGYLKDLQANGFTDEEIKAAGLGFSADTDFSKVTGDELDKVIDNIVSNAANKQLHIEEMDNYGVKNKSLAFQKDSAADNLATLQAYRELEQGGELSKEAQMDKQARENAFKAQMVNAGISDEWITAYNEALENGNATIGDTVYSLEDIESSLQRQIEMDKEINALLESQKYQYDALNLLTEKTNSLMRERELMEREFQRAIDNETASYADISKYTQSLVSNLQTRATNAGDTYNKSKENLASHYGDVSSEMREFIVVDPNTGSVQADEEGFAAKYGDNPEMLENFEKTVELLQGDSEAMAEAQDTMYDIQDEIDELQKQGKEEYNDLLSGVQDALIDQRQEEIDKLQDVNDAIVEAGEQLVTKMQEQIEADRQARENEKKEKSLMDKQSKLAQLRRDTSGSNALEIQKLEQELADEEEAYQDTLVDQAVDRLAKQNDRAAEQRQAQIDLMQSQLDYWEEFGSAIEAERILNESLNNTSTPFAQTVAGQLLANSEGIKGMTEAQKKDYEATLNQTGALAQFYHLESENTNDILRNIGQAISTGLKVGADFSGVGVTEGEKGKSLVVDNPYAKETQGNQKSVSASGSASYTEKDAELEEPTLNWWQQFWQVTLPGWFKKIGEFFGGVWSNVIQPIWIVITKIFEMIWAGLEPIWDFLCNYIFGPIGKALTAIWNGIKKFFGWIGNILGNIWDWLSTNVFGPLWDGISEFWTSITTWIKENAGLPFQEFFAGLWQKITEAFTNFGAKIGEIFGNIGEGISNVWQKIVGFFQNAWDKITNLFGKLGDWFKNSVIAPIGNFFKELGTNIGNFFKNAWDKIKDTWQSVKDWFQSKVIDPIKNAFVKMGEGIKNVWNGILNVIESIINGCIKGINWLIRGLNKFQVKVPDWVPGIGGKKWGFNIKEVEEVQLKKYETGGLADYTGPAWLDGTPSKPELVLNQRDTQNFLALKDVLSDVVSKGGLDKDGNGAGSGDNYFEIEINVDSIGDDYDVEQMAEKIKSIIYEDSMYRNVNAINQIR